jgi:hypothetical protein
MRNTFGKRYYVLFKMSHFTCNTGVRQPDKSSAIILPGQKFDKQSKLQDRIANDL